jgi:hypothetical protein
MGIKSEKIHTQILSGGIFTFTADMGIRTVSMVLMSGTGEFIGTLNIGAISSTGIPLTIGVPVTISTDSSFAAIDGLTIDSRVGEVYFIARQ